MQKGTARILSITKILIGWYSAQIALLWVRCTEKTILIKLVDKESY